MQSRFPDSSTNPNPEFPFAIADVKVSTSTSTDDEEKRRESVYANAHSRVEKEENRVENWFRVPSESEERKLFDTAGTPQLRNRTRNRDDTDRLREEVNINVTAERRDGEAEDVAAGGGAGTEDGEGRRGRSRTRRPLGGKARRRGEAHHPAKSGKAGKLGPERGHDHGHTADNSRFPGNPSSSGTTGEPRKLDDERGIRVEDARDTFWCGSGSRGGFEWGAGSASEVVPATPVESAGAPSATSGTAKATASGITSARYESDMETISPTLLVPRRLEPLQPQPGHGCSDFGKPHDEDQRSERQPGERGPETLAPAEDVDNAEVAGARPVGAEVRGEALRLLGAFSESKPSSHALLSVVTPGSAYPASTSSRNRSLTLTGIVRSEGNARGHTVTIPRIQTLPPDILYEIFLWTLPHPSEPSSLEDYALTCVAPLNLERVCHSWRAVVKANKGLWAVVRLDLDLMASRRVDQWMRDGVADSMLGLDVPESNRASGSGLGGGIGTVDALEAHPPDSSSRTRRKKEIWKEAETARLTTLASRILPLHISRSGSSTPLTIQLKLTAPTPLLVELLALLAAHAPRLASLSVDLMHSTRGSPSSLSSFSSFLCAPSADPGALLLPPDLRPLTLIRMPYLRELRLDLPTWTDTLDLSALPELEHLHVRVWSAREVEVWTDGRVMKRLKSVVLDPRNEDATLSVAGVLALLHVAPNLETLVCTVSPFDGPAASSAVSSAGETSQTELHERLRVMGIGVGDMEVINPILRPPTPSFSTFPSIHAPNLKILGLLYADYAESGVRCILQQLSAPNLQELNVGLLDGSEFSAECGLERFFERSSLERTNEMKMMDGRNGWTPKHFTASTLSREQLGRALRRIPELDSLSLDIVDDWAGIFEDLTLPPLDLVHAQPLCPRLRFLRICWLGEDTLTEPLIQLILSRWNLSSSPSMSDGKTGMRRCLDTVDLHHCEPVKQVMSDPRIQLCMREGLVILDSKNRYSLAEHCGLPSLPFHH